MGDGVMLCNTVLFAFFCSISFEHHIISNLDQLGEPVKERSLSGWFPLAIVSLLCLELNGDAMEETAVRVKARHL